MEEEKWVDINVPGLSLKYQVSSHGHIKRLACDVVVRKNGTDFNRRLREKAVKIQNNKYQIVPLMVNGKQKMFYVHRLVALAFVPNPNNYPEVNHKNENKYDNNVENLEWCEHAYNTRFGTRMERVRKTLIENGRWHDYSGFTEEEKKEAQLLLQKEWRENNKERSKEWRRNYRQNNKEDISARSKKWCDNNKEKRKGYKRKTYDKNREHYLKYQRCYNKEHYTPKMDHTVNVYDCATGEFIGEYRNAVQAGKALNVNRTTIWLRLKEETLKPIKGKYIVSKMKCENITEKCG